jgi:rRNA processing protein Krr1/Pno1
MFKISLQLKYLDQDIIFGIVYISYLIYRVIERVYLSINNNYVALIGDFNGRTADENDFFVSTENHGNDATRFIENDTVTLDKKTMNIPPRGKDADAIKKQKQKKNVQFSNT